MIAELSIDDVGCTVWYVQRHAHDDKSQWERAYIQSFNNPLGVAWIIFSKGDDAIVDRSSRTPVYADYRDLRLEK